MSHLLLAPILVPAATAVLLLLNARQPVAMHRAVSLVSALVQVGMAHALLSQSATGIRSIYALGDWPIPFGIILVSDRLSATMVLLTTVLGLVSLLSAIPRWDERGRNFHPLFQFQLMGLCGAFLTGDIFNLFVFFEILLIASYGLLLHGGGAERMRAGLHYVVINLSGSALFILGLGLTWSTFGTLTMADLAHRLPGLLPTSLPLAMSTAGVLLVVFGLKAAAAPVHGWLPAAYGAAGAPVAALFAVMTKVGIYAILRVYSLVFGELAGDLSGFALPWLVGAGLLTLVLSAAGALAQTTLRGLVAYLMVGSSGTLLTAVGVGTLESTAAALYYLVHSTLTAAAFFLLAERIADDRPMERDGLVPGAVLRRPMLWGGVFMILSMAAAGLPPLGGFVGKAMLLSAALATDAGSWVTAVVLLASLGHVIALSRAGSALFWNVRSDAGVGTDERAEVTNALPESPSVAWPIFVLVTLLLVWTAGAGWAWEWMLATGAQVLDAGGYVNEVLPPQWPEFPAPGTYGGH